jgi:hypothetical protein
MSACGQRQDGFDRRRASTAVGRLGLRPPEGGEGFGLRMAAASGASCRRRRGGTLCGRRRPVADGEGAM